MDGLDELAGLVLAGVDGRDPLVGRAWGCNGPGRVFGVDGREEAAEEVLVLREDVLEVAPAAGVEGLDVWMAARATELLLAAGVLAGILPPFEFGAALCKET